MLKTVRYGGDGRLTLNVHWVQAPATVTTMAWCGPSSRSAMRLAAQATESVEPLLVWRGRLTFHADVMQESATSAANETASGIVVGKNFTIRKTPPMITPV